MQMENDTFFLPFHHRQSCCLPIGRSSVPKSQMAFEYPHPLVPFCLFSYCASLLVAPAGCSPPSSLASQARDDELCMLVMFNLLTCVFEPALKRFLACGPAVLTGCSSSAALHCQMRTRGLFTMLEQHFFFFFFFFFHSIRGKKYRKKRSRCFWTCFIHKAE